MALERAQKSFEQELEHVAKLLIQMGGLAETQLESAIQTVLRRDAGLAIQIMQTDEHLDAAERQIDAEAVRLLARHESDPRHVREIVSALRIAGDLERIGDYAANIAKRAVAIAQMPAVRPALTISRLGRRVQQSLKDVLDAYSQRDVELATEVWLRDRELDDLYTSLFREILSHMSEDPRAITSCTHLLFIAKNLERIGDHATNVAELVHVLVVGKPIGNARPKSDQSSFTVTPQAAAGS